MLELRKVDDLLLLDPLADPSQARSRNGNIRKFEILSKGKIQRDLPNI